MRPATPDEENENQSMPNYSQILPSNQNKPYLRAY